MQVSYKKHLLKFKFDAGTSRGVLKTKGTYIIKVSSPAQPNIVGYGECGPLEGLSPDDVPDFEVRLHDFLTRFSQQPGLETIQKIDSRRYPSIKLGLETALKDFENGGQKIIFDTDFTRRQQALPINGLLWMAPERDMLMQAEEKLKAGFRCIKMKIGAIDFAAELRILQYLRNQFPESLLTIRVDANGAFSPQEAPEKLKRLSDFQIHSIEQPVKPGQLELMTALCADSPIPIALDEELISCGNKAQLLDTINPAYIILKPTLLGGFNDCDEWIAEAEKRNIGWWITSALESNIGLNAICQYTALKDPKRDKIHGLGTGSLYHNNFVSPLHVNRGTIACTGLSTWSEDIHALCEF